jgi:hypothetical protein
MQKLFALLLVVVGLVAITAAAGLAFGLPAALTVGGIQALATGLLMPDGDDTTKRGADGKPPA